MIGNDIVDFEDPEAQPTGTHPRFDQRAFSDDERKAILQSGDSVRERWVLWAAKEAAYKLLRATDPTTVFSPPRFEVTRAGPSRASVRFGDRILSVDLEIRRGSVHAVARSEGRRRIVSATARHHGADPSRSVRALAIDAVAPYLGAAPEELRIEREQGRPPVLFDKDQPIDSALSLSHHGRFVAFACELPPGAGWSS
ncbi:MAG: 4'-phosphopantetheinyl transferase superfamily protein [Candidatus Binatia bacterium]|nr:4'-phosphopantetheinyl transferase superfamily protein [Candidatus Binatia bacterium]